MRLALLIVLAAAVVAGAAGSYYHFQSWRENRYDDFIIEAAKDHNVDPALVKALIKVQTDFGADAQVGDSQGLLLIPPRVADLYLEAHGRTDWGFTCVNRHFRNHDPNKPEQYTSAVERACRAPGCNAQLTEELKDPATNIEVGCWFLDQAQGPIRQRYEAPPDARVPPDLLVVAYRWGLPEGREVGLSESQKAFVGRVLQATEKYRTPLTGRARQAAGN